MARISIKPTESLEIEFADGTIKEAWFNNEAFIYFLDEFGDILNELKSAEDKPFEFVAKVLYCGIKTTDKNITLDEAQSILVRGGLEMINLIMQLMVDNFLNTADEDSKKNYLREVAQMEAIMKRK